MTKFISNSNNPYANLNKSDNKDVKEKFVSKSKAETIQIFKDCTVNTTGKKVTFKHVQNL